MNAEIKHQLDERLIEGAMTPDEYLAEVRAHCEQAADPDELGKPPCLLYTSRCV